MPELAKSGYQHAQAPPRPFKSLSFYTDRATFDSDYPGLPNEDFEEATVLPGGVSPCDTPINSQSDDSCFSPGDIVPGVDIQDNPSYSNMAALGPGFFGNPSKVVGPAAFADFLEIVFTTNETYAAGMLILSNVAGVPVPIEIYSSDGALLGTSSVTPSATGVFWGVGSDQAIGRILFQSPDVDMVDDLAFGGTPGGPEGWATAEPESGSILPGNSATIDLIFDSRGMYQVGDFTANLTFAGNFANLVPSMPLTMSLSCPTCVLDRIFLPQILNVVDRVIPSQQQSGNSQGVESFAVTSLTALGSRPHAGRVEKWQ
jgi:hypothetical protein